MKRFEAVKEAKEEAENTKTRLQDEKEAKVSIIPFPSEGDAIAHRRIGSGTPRSAPKESWDGGGT